LSQASAVIFGSDSPQEIPTLSAKPVEAAELLGAARDRRPDRGDIGDVDHIGKGLAAFGSDLRNCMIGGFLADVDAGDMRALARKQHRHRPPVADRGASSMILRWPAPTTMMRRSCRRPWLFASPSVSA